VRPGRLPVHCTFAARHDEDRGANRSDSERANSPLPATFLPGQVIWADSTADSTGPQLLYQAIGAGNLRAWVQGQDDRGGAALSN
jgi:hypothetical protein